MKETDAIPTRIQVVFQGGGAKLCLLMAVCRVLRDYEAKKRIEITRVAGSSAGAIAAAMLASHKSVDVYRADLRLKAPKYLRALNVNKMRGLWRISQGQAFFKDLDLLRFFADLFSSDGGPKLVQDLRVRAELYLTDLYSLNSRAAAQGEALSSALAKSCRFPFAFVGFQDGNTDVDGGLAMNLPVDHLKAEESTEGRVLGVSFAGGFGATGKGNLLSYTQQLFSAAIQSGVSRSEGILGKPNIFQIETDIGTFDFAEALDAGLDIHYQLVTEQFKSWLDAWLGPPTTTEIPDGTGRYIRPILSNDPYSPAILRELDDHLRARPCTHALGVYNYETAIIDSSGDFSLKYKTRSIMKFTVTRKTNVLQFGFQTGKGQSFLDVNLKCSAIDSKGRSLRFVPHVQDISEKDDAHRSFLVYFLFEEPLRPENKDQPFIVEYNYEGSDPYPNLGTSLEISTLTRWQGDADEMILAIAFPRARSGDSAVHTDICYKTADELRKAGYKDDGEALVASTELALFDFVDHLNLDFPPERYWLVGRRATGVKQGQSFGIAIE